MADPRRGAVMMAGRHLVREAERGHVIDRRLTRSRHHRDDRRDESGIGGEGLLDPFLGDRARSEEHTSELQSLMRISYAVFCLKKKIHTHTSQTFNVHI